MTQGITVRHQARCNSRTGGDCDCKPRYQAEAYDKRTGRRMRRTFENKTAAKQWRTDARAALRAGQITAHTGPTLRQATEDWLAGARAGHIKNRSGDPYKPAAIRGYEKDLRLRVLPTLGALKLREIRHPDLQQLIDQLVSDGCAPATVQGAITPLRAIYRRAIVRGVATENPTRGLELPAIRSKPRRFASPQEADQIVTSLTGAARALWATALYAGLRRGELTGLQWQDVDLAAGVIRVRRGWDACEGEIAPKSHKGRRNVPIPAVLRDPLLEHRMTSDGDGSVFGTAWTVRQLADKVTTLSLHDARHSYASLMIAAGVNPKALSTYMGHANIQVTFDLYGHLMPGAEDEAAGLLDAYLARAAGGTVPENEREKVEA
jgi:integrase